MPLYRVTIPVDGWMTYEVRARSEDEARKKVSDEGGTKVDEGVGYWSDNLDEWDVTLADSPNA